ncbi:MAG TPA: hypothetical protein VF727_15860 [Allosphingosinicella sp.]
MRISRTLPALAAGLLLAFSPASAAFTQEAPKQPLSGLAELRTLIEQMRADILKPGEVLPGWNVGGADADAELRALGADKHYYLLKDGAKQEVGILTDKRISEFAPARWKVLDTYGSPVSYAENPSVHFSPLGSRYFVGMRSGGWRQNGVDCSKDVTHAMLFEDPDLPPGKEDAAAAIGLFRIALLALEGQTICARADGDAKQGWRIKHLLPDGRSLPELDDKETVMTIVPAAPVESLVKAAPEA